MVRTRTDAVDAIAAQWAGINPALDVSPMQVIGRISRLSRLIDRVLAANFAKHGLENWMYDVLATLRRNGPPFELTAGDLVRQTMVTTGAMTNRIDRLAERGYVERANGADRRTVIVRLTETGRTLIDEVSVTHMATEQQILAALTPKQREQLADLLRVTLVSLGDC
jgi:DNA-binding MarR family transcriptional regulator